MHSTTSRNDIGQNSSDGNSRQNNVVVTHHVRSQNNYFSLPRQRELQLQSFLSLPENQSQNLPMEQVQDYLRSITTIAGAQRTIRERDPSCQNGGECLPGCNIFKYEIEAYAQEHTDRQSVLDQLSDANFHIINEWMRETCHQVLLVVGEQGNWTTNLLLELMDLERQQTTAFAAHLCGQNFDSKGGQREAFLIRDLLGQLIESYKDDSDDIHACLRTESTTQEINAADIEVKRLWDLFTECIKKVGIRKILIVLDRIDYILLDCSDEAFYEFVNTLVTFCRTLGDDGVTVKMVVISGDFIVTSFFNDIEALRMIELPVPPC
ncbi:hypothetical protein F5Y13DRAFT_200762 [Hypoxylon sp. FL1857]|nr:hypothetical protein F5Y13DRAFT_200762 [Hypoxylon sp. FL1857]